MKKYLLLWLLCLAQDSWGQATPLENSLVAAINSGNSLEVGRLLAQNPHLVNLRIGSNKYSPLYLAVMRGNYELVKKITSINQHQVAVSGNKNGMSPISLAASLNRSDLVEVMWESQEDKSEIFATRDDTHSRTFLHWISSQSVDEKLLTKVYKAASENSIVYQDRHSKSPVNYLAERGIKNIPIEVAQELLAKAELIERSGSGYSKLNSKKLIEREGYFHWNENKILGIARLHPELLGEIKSSSGRRALYWAIDNKVDPTFIRELVEQNPDQILKNPDANEYIKLAARNGQTDTVRYLTQKNPALLYSKELYSYPAHAAALGGESETAIALLKLEPRALTEWNDVHKGLFLHTAAEQSGADLINYVLDKAPSQISEKDLNGKLPLHLAAAHNNEVAALILAKKNLLSLEAPDNYGFTPIAYAIKNGFLDLAKKLIDLKPELLENLKIEGVPALNYCAVKFSPSQCLPLIKINPKLLKMPHGSTTVLHQMASLHAGDHAAIAETAKLYPENLLVHDSESKTPLHHAVHAGLPLTKELAALEPKALLLKDAKGYTPLMHSVSIGSMDTSAYLAGLEPKALLERDKKGNTPLHLAAELGLRAEIITTLAKLEPKALELKNDLGQSPLHLAAQYQYGVIGNLKLLAQLSPAAAKIKDNENCLPLHYAAQSEDESGDSAEFLASLAPDTIEATDSKGCNVLHLAAQKKNKGRIKTLSKLHPANLLAKNHAGKTPIENITKNHAGLDFGNSHELRRLHNIYTPDLRVTDGNSPPTRTMLFESDPNGDPFFPNAKDNEKAKDFSDFLSKFNLSRLKNSLLLALSSCGTPLRFTHHQIPTERAISVLELRGRKSAQALEWETLSITDRLASAGQLFQIDPSQLTQLKEKMESLQKDPAFSNIKNRFLLLSGKFLTEQSEVRNVCTELSKRSKSEIESHLGALWVDAKEKNGDNAKIPLLAGALAVTEAELGTYSHTDKFLDEDLLGEKRDAIAPVVSHCVDCHNPTAKDVDYPLSFKKVDLDRAPDSPKSKEKTLRAETLRRLDLPATDPAKMPKGADHELSPDQTKALKDFLSSENKGAGQ